MIKIIAEETGETRGNKIGVDMTIEVKGEINDVTTQLGHALHEIWKKDPKIILKVMNILRDLIEGDLFNA